MESSARTLESVLSDLLDLARIESGRLDLQQVRFGLGEVVHEAAALWRMEAEKKGLKLDIVIAPDAEGAVEGDPVRLRQIVVNLLSNAVKFTEAGGVSLTVSRRPDAPERAVIEVADTGVGFEPEIAERLFERFEQADGSYTRRFGGTGLGLAICRDLAERMGGTITAEGQPGAGATFLVDLPLAPQAHPEAAEPGASQASGADAEDRPIRVLAAEDHPVNRKVVEYIMQAAGAELTCVENGKEALATFKREPFDVVLMDMQMPVMDGLAATRAIRAFEKKAGRGHTPVIMVTAHNMPEHVQASHAAGADRHLAKPIAAVELLTTLSEVVSESCPVAA
jgi:CheY-like chemotaxis protein